MNNITEIKIRRAQIISTLVIPSLTATLLTGCFEDESNIIGVREFTPNDKVANQPVKAVFYKTVAQCKSDIQEKKTAYKIALEKYYAGEVKQKPLFIAINPEDCEAQMVLAQLEHSKNAPIYETRKSCENEGVSCGPLIIDDGITKTVYSPRFGGAFFYPYSSRVDFIYFNYGGVRRRLYKPSTVYQGAGNNLVTPYGRVLPNYQPGKYIFVPQHTQFTAPSRPDSPNGTGIIRGRSSSGFGSTYKRTGPGGIGK